MSLEKRQLIEREVRRIQHLTGIALLTLVLYAGVPARTWREWQGRREAETKHNGHIPREHWLTPEETESIAAYCLENLDKGYRVLCWEMVDKGIAAVSPSSVYKVLQRKELTKKWAALAEEEKQGFVQPVTVHEQWHIDFSYIRICGVFYYFISILDGYSRKILVWSLCQNMEGLNAEILTMRAKELYPEASPRIISDNGGQFISKDFRELVALLEFQQTFTSPAHPQSNGKLERFHRTLKTEHIRRTAYVSYEDAQERMDRWIEYYNTERLHSAIWYLTPEEVFQGKAADRIAERRGKLHTAYINRQAYWQQLSAGV